MQRVARKEDRETRGEGGGGVLSYKRLIGMYRWMRSHFHDWIDYNGVAFTRMSYYNEVAHFRIFWDKTVLHIYG